MQRRLVVAQDLSVEKEGGRGPPGTAEGNGKEGIMAGDVNHINCTPGNALLRKRPMIALPVRIEFKE